MMSSVDIRKEVRETEAWKAWNNRYHLIRFKGKNPARFVEAQWKPLPPDTYDNMTWDFETGTDTVPFSRIEEELSPKQIQANWEHCSVLASIAVMQFFRENP